jgi:RluA family pseudouridine synthase
LKYYIVLTSGTKPEKSSVPCAINSLDMKGELHRMITALHLLVSTSRSVAFNPMQLRNPNIGFRAAQATRTRAPHPDKFRRLVVCSSSNLKNIPAQRHEWHYEILQTYPILNVDQMEQSLPRFIHSINPNEYSSVSQAKKACRFGAIIVSRDKDAFGKQSKEEDCVDFDMYTTSDKFEVLDQNRTIFIASPETTVVEGDVIAVRARIKDSFYPSSCTGYVHPPAKIECIEVIYEDDHISVVNKPELLSTIGEKRQDLQSCLPFILSPPLKKFWPSHHSPSLPRPVHRLDRRTSGLVLVAKTKSALSTLSESFRAREIEKSYTAIVFGQPDNSSVDAVEDEDFWHAIDYPIDGKPSVTLWRSICSVETSAYGTLTLLLCRPKTGRYHQIRRHLSYCLGTPIVGDNKYDKGRETARNARSLGMFLCSNAIEFKHPFPNNDEAWSSIQSHSVLMAAEGASQSYSFDDVFTHNPLDTLHTSVKIRVDTTNPKRKDTIFHMNIPLPAKFKDVLNNS